MLQDAQKHTALVCYPGLLVVTAVTLAKHTVGLRDKPNTQKQYETGKEEVQLWSLLSLEITVGNTDLNQAGSKHGDVAGQHSAAVLVPSPYVSEEDRSLLLHILN